LEWDLLAGHICLTTPTLTSAHLTSCGLGGMDGDEAEAEAGVGVTDLVGGGLCPTGMAGGKIITYNFVRR
jgi:hypothetical protein